MHDDLKQKISQLLDDDLGRQEAFSLLKTIQSNPGLKDKLTRYETISHALKTEVFLLPDREFSNRIHQRIKQEPLHLLPQHKLVTRNRNFFGKRKFLATAASLAAVGVLAGLTMNHRTQDFKMASANPGMPSRQQVSEPLNKQINDYLQAHNSSVYTNGQANFQPYARVTTYSQK